LKGYYICIIKHKQYFKPLKFTTMTSAAQTIKDRQTQHLQNLGFDNKTIINEAGMYGLMWGDDATNKCHLYYFRGNSLKPTHYVYSKMESLFNDLNRFIGNRTAIQDSKNKAKQERKEKTESFANEVEVGSIFYTSWGYEQTNVEFYQVVEKTGKKVGLRELKQEHVNKDGYSSMSSHVIALPNQFASNEIQTKILKDGHISFESYRSGYLWGGVPKYVSWYA
jgi:hypothetical protein